METFWQYFWQVQQALDLPISQSIEIYSKAWNNISSINLNITIQIKWRFINISSWSKVLEWVEVAFHSQLMCLIVILLTRLPHWGFILLQYYAGCSLYSARIKTECVGNAHQSFQWMVHETCIFFKQF